MAYFLWLSETYTLSFCEGRTGDSTVVEGNSLSAMPDAGSSIKENFKLTGRALQTLAKRAADIVDTNPAKVALGLVKAIIEINDVRNHSSQRAHTEYYSRL
jgi:hypothetical protein